MKHLREHLLAVIQDLDYSVDADDDPDANGIRVAVVGRPNVGKSTLVNRLVGEERQVVFDMPGTTKDAIDIPFSKDGVDFVLIDTAVCAVKASVENYCARGRIVGGARPRGDTGIGCPRGCGRARFACAQLCAGRGCRHGGGGE